jgi:hypothetical protein
MIVEILVLKGMIIKKIYYVVPINKIIKYLESKSKHKLKILDLGCGRNLIYQHFKDNKKMSIIGYDYVSFNNSINVSYNAVLNNGSSSSGDYEINSLWLHLGAGWFLVQSVGASGSHTDTINYTLSASLATGSYGIFAYNNYNTAGSASYASGNFYSLHVVA